MDKTRSDGFAGEYCQRYSGNIIMTCEASERFSAYQAEALVEREVTLIINLDGPLDFGSGLDSSMLPIAHIPSDKQSFVAVMKLS